MPLNTIKIHWNAIFKQCGDTPSRESHWVLMSRDVVPGTRSKSFEKQRAIVESFGAAQVPTLLEAAVCILMEHVHTGNRLYSDSPWTYTRCVENVRGYRTVIGGFSAGGLRVYPRRRYDDEGIGLASLRKF